MAVIFDGDRLQQPVIPVQNAQKTATNAIINRAIIVRPISIKKNQTKRNKELLMRIILNT